MRKTLVALVALLATASSEAAAQACIGVPARNGQVNVAANFDIPEDSVVGYGAELTANLAGPLSVGANATLYKLDLGEDAEAFGLDDDFWSFGARAAWEIPVSGLSVCPTAGIQRMSYSGALEDFDASFDISAIQVPIGVGIGTTIELTPGAELTLFGIPQVVWQRATFEGRAFGITFDETDSQTNFAGELGLRLGTRGFYAGASVAKIFADDPEGDEEDFSVGAAPSSEAVLRLTLGFSFGTRR